MAKRTQYTQEFKDEVVALCRLGDRTSAQVARDLGLNYHTLMSWQKAAQMAAEPEALSVSEKEELKRLRRENERLRMEREILKKATAFFASQSL
jgi:transposase